MIERSLIAALVGAFLAGQTVTDEIAARAAKILGRTPRWLRPLAKRFVAEFEGGTRPRRRDVGLWLTREVARLHLRNLHVEHWITEPQEMQPAPAAGTWGVPRIESVSDLAGWLSLSIEELEWFASLEHWKRAKFGEKLQHYFYRVLQKQSGRVRLIEEPKPRLKVLQQKILREILDLVPMHPAAHGFVKGRSIQTFVRPHTGQRVVLRMDLQDFFPTFPAVRIQAFFRTLGYPEAAADRLGGICTNSVPWEVRARLFWESRVLYGKPHLPQGAPTSPSLANLCAYRVDCRLSGLAKSAGAAHTRYADDLAFSGDKEFERQAKRFETLVAVIVHEEGFQVHHRKTRLMRQGVRQHLAGLVTNERPNVMRPDFDRLKATLTNCIRHGVESQNRDGHQDFRAHLEGRVGFVESINPGKGRRLRTLLELIR